MQSLSGSMSQFGNAPTVDKEKHFVTARVADRGSVQGGGRMHHQIVPIWRGSVLCARGVSKR